MPDRLRKLARRGLGRLGGARGERYDVVFYVPSVGSLIASGGSSPAGGAETQALLNSRALAQRGYRVAMIAYGSPPSMPKELDGVRIVVRPPYRPRAGALGGVVEALLIWWSLWRVPSRTVITRCAGPQVGLIAIYARLGGRRMVYASAALLDFNWQRVLITRRDQWLYALGLRIAHAIVVQTEEQVVLCEAAIGRRAVLIKSIVEPAGASNGAPDAFLWVGRYHPLKRPMDYIELARAVPEARFVMVAVPYDRELERAVVAAAGEAQNVELLPPRSRAGISALLSRAVASVNTSEAEGMSNVFLEGWSIGVPALALAHDPGGVIAAYGVGGFAGGSKQTMIELAREQWANRADRGALAARCRAYVADQHSPAVVAQAWCRVLGL